jgi:hypothetical protein
MLYTTLKGDTRCFNAKNTHSHQKVAVVRVAVGVCQRKMKDKIAMLASMSNICQVSRAYSLLTVQPWAGAAVQTGEAEVQRIAGEAAAGAVAGVP